MKSHHWGVLEIIHKERSHFLFKAWSSRAQIGPLKGLNSKFQKKVRPKDASLIIVLYSTGRFRPWATGWGWGFACLVSSVFRELSINPILLPCHWYTQIFLAHGWSELMEFYYILSTKILSVPIHYTGWCKWEDIDLWPLMRQNLQKWVSQFANNGWSVKSIITT